MRYGLIGEKLGHSYSKIIHEALRPMSYDLIELTKEEVHTFFQERRFAAINVTIPYKQTVIPYLSEMDDAARRIGAVNCIVNCDGQLKGYNTDYYGFAQTLVHFGVEVAGKKVLMLGNGGASKAVLAVLQDFGAREVLTVKYKPEEGCILYEEAYASHTDAEMIVNTSPVGMYPKCDASPMDLTPFASLEAVCDLIYNPFETKLLQQANTLGIKAVNGLLMLVLQAKKASELFFGDSLPMESSMQIYESIAEELRKA